ncbi:MAG: hypothetical protein Q8K45_21300 [Rubrivivax sp.]|nr:hypothetical protein [Rubrivivax sp.]
MNLYLLVVVMTLLPLPGTQQPKPLDLHRQFVGASKLQVCQAEADKLAAQLREVHAEDVARFKASVGGFCLPVKGHTPRDQA